MSEIVGIHPHAECYPLLGDDELAALAADITENGLRDPLTVTPDGCLIDGRNRLRACEIAGVQPRVVVYEGADVGAFVRSRNLRRHQPLGSLAMSTALSMQTDGLRTDGRWRRGSLDNQEFLNTDWRNKITQCGIVLDFKPDLAPEVVSGAIKLNDAFTQACAVRDAESLKREEQQRIEAEEAAAQEFITATDPDLARQVSADGQIRTYREAVAVWEQRNREEAHRIAQEKRDWEQAVKRDADRLRSFLHGFDTAVLLDRNTARDDILAALHDLDRDRFLRIEKETSWPSTLI